MYARIEQARRAKTIVHRLVASSAERVAAREHKRPNSAQASIRRMHRLTPYTGGHPMRSKPASRPIRADGSLLVHPRASVVAVGALVVPFGVE